VSSTTMPPKRTLTSATTSNLPTSKRHKVGQSSTAVALKKKGLDLAKSKFRLPNPLPFTDEAWDSYTQNRSGLPKVRATCVRSVTREVDEDDSNTWSDDDDGRVLDMICISLKAIEKELGLDNKVLQDSVWSLWCDGDFPESPWDKANGIDCRSRVYSITTPAYIDIHFMHDGYEYALGYKICAPPSPEVCIFGPGHDGKSAAVTHKRDGWNSICFGIFDKNRENLTKRSRFGFTQQGMIDLHDALFEPLPPLPAKPSEAALKERQQALARTIRILLACVGIDHRAACTDEEAASLPPSHEWPSCKLNSSTQNDTNGWFAKGIRKACGIRLTEDKRKKKAK